MSPEKYEANPAAKCMILEFILIKLPLLLVRAHEVINAIAGTVHVITDHKKRCNT